MLSKRRRASSFVTKGDQVKRPGDPIPRKIVSWFVMEIILLIERDEWRVCYSSFYALYRDYNRFVHVLVHGFWCESASWFASSDFYSLSGPSIGND